MAKYTMEALIRFFEYDINNEGLIAVLFDLLSCMQDNHRIKLELDFDNQYKHRIHGKLAKSNIIESSN